MDALWSCSRFIILSIVKPFIFIPASQKKRIALLQSRVEGRGVEGGAVYAVLSFDSIVVAKSCEICLGLGLVLGLGLGLGLEGRIMFLGRVSGRRAGFFVNSRVFRAAFEGHGRFRELTRGIGVERKSMKTNCGRRM